MVDQAVGAGRKSPPRKWSFYDREVQGIIWQAVILGLVLGIGYYLFSNMQHNLERRSIQTGFEFLGREAGFAIGETLIEYSPASHYARAILVGILNTLLVAVIGIVLATLIGVTLGIATLSKNWLVVRLTGTYISVLRNLPVLLQIVFWYAIFINERFFQSARGAEPLIGDVYLTNRGLFFPEAIAHPGWTNALIALLIAAVGAWAVSVWAERRRNATGQTFPVFAVGAGLVALLPVAAWFFSGAPWEFDVPRATRFALRGGGNITPEFLALLTGLTVYTSAFIAEIVRAGILAVPKGQTEAARAIGLKENVIMRQVILPQALRVIIPPTTSQYLNLTKNSSLAVAIGYPDLVNVGNTTINQTGQAPEGILIMMIVYLTFSLTTSLIMNWYNARIQLVER